MSNFVSVIIRIAHDSRQASIQIPRNIKVGELIEVTQKTWDLPSDLSYVVRLERTGKELNNSMSFNSIEIKENDLLTLYQNVDGGGIIVNSLIVEQLDYNGTSKVFKMMSTDRYGDLVVALLDEYEEPREGPFHFLDHQYAKIFSKDFAKCQSRKLGTKNFFELHGNYQFCTKWRGIPTKQRSLSYYALSLPEYGIIKAISIRDPKNGEELSRSVIRDDQRNRFVIYIECRVSNSDGVFDFDLICQFTRCSKKFYFSNYTDSLTTNGALPDAWEYVLGETERNKVKKFLEPNLYKIVKSQYELVLLTVGSGDLDSGFPRVIAQFWSNDVRFPSQFTAALPPSSKISETYHHWQEMYDCLSASNRLEKSKNQITNYSKKELELLSKSLVRYLNEWLNSELFRPIQERLLQKFNLADEVRVIIQTEDIELRLLPWHLWNFFDTYRKAEVALSPTAIDHTLKSILPRKQIRILSILGDSTNIDVEVDRKLLENLPKSETVFLVEPSRQEIDEYLWDERGWDILCFSGHSSSKWDGSSGYIYINKTEYLSLDKLKNALLIAIEKGLKLAIFNSCDGLGLAHQLASLHIPQIIVMRKPVPDLVAQEFLKHFLRAFTNGKSLYASMREARERLQGLEEIFPCASWLPVICQNPAEL
jgi:CHAT domain